MRLLLGGRLWLLLGHGLLFGYRLRLLLGSRLRLLGLHVLASGDKVDYRLGIHLPDHLLDLGRIGSFQVLLELGAVYLV